MKLQLTPSIMASKKFNVFNATDGFYATHEEFTKKQAERFVKNFWRRYEHQGYYRDKNLNKLDPKSVNLFIVPAGKSIAKYLEFNSKNQLT